jgi:DNA repair protein RecO (recombination protein O)
MLTKTRGIVLHSLKLGDSSLIVTVYTEKYGRISCIVHATKGMRAKNKAAILQPMFLLDMEIYYKKSREVQRIKEIILIEPYQSIPFDVRKSSQVFFLAEILYKILQEEESNPALFAFIESTFVFFDIMKEGAVNFHVWFLTHLTEYIGVFPHLEEGKKGWFDMQKGVITGSIPMHPFFMDQETTAYLKKILELNISGLYQLNINNNQRNILLNSLLHYYQIHFENLGNIKSLSVLKEVFE